MTRKKARASGRDQESIERHYTRVDFEDDGGASTSEARYIPASEPAAEWKMMQPRKQGVEYYPDHNGNFFYIRVNDTGRNFRLVKAPVTDPRSQNWQEVIPHRANVMLDDTDFFQNYYVLSERENGLPQIRVSDLRSGESRRIEFPEPAYANYGYACSKYDTNKFSTTTSLSLRRGRSSSTCPGQRQFRRGLIPFSRAAACPRERSGNLYPH